jgi:xanthine/CO dehydrogenase XdhC/CoxF family maturation factor
VDLPVGGAEAGPVRDHQGVERAGRVFAALQHPGHPGAALDTRPVDECLHERPVERLGEVGERSDVVFTDHDAPGVTELLAELLRSRARFIGVMGSRRHVAHYVESLGAMGFDDADLSRIRSPLGLDLGGRSPEEIALSIAAGLVAARYGRDGGWLDRA